MNKRIINEYEKLLTQLNIEQLNLKDKEKVTNSYRIQSTKRILEVLKSYKQNIKNGEELADIKGIGKHTVDRINEILKSGKLEEIDEDLISQKYLDTIDELVKIYGIGKSKAYELYKKYGVKNISDLKKLSETVELPQNIKIGLQYFGKSKENIPRKEMEDVDKYLFKIALKVDPKLHYSVCGSYRRNYGTQKTSNDIDVLLVHPNDEKCLGKFIKKLIDEKFIVASLTNIDVPTKYMGLCKIDKHIRRIDIREVDYKSYYYAILYFTGPRDFNKKMRQIAISMGYTLNEYGMCKKNKKCTIANSEKEIFDALNMEYLTPDLRK
jgi:DNA polymerase/3'-5' exonuclease PolX